MRIDSVIIKPVLTEKATGGAARQVYTFEVVESANKHNIKTTLEALYKVKVGSVRISAKRGKTRRVGRRMRTIQLPDRKIAYVHLKEGSIDIFPKS